MCDFPTFPISGIAATDLDHFFLKSSVTLYNVLFCYKLLKTEEPTFAGIFSVYIYLKWDRIKVKLGFQKSLMYKDNHQWYHITQVEVLGDF